MMYLQIIFDKSKLYLDLIFPPLFTAIKTIYNIKLRKKNTLGEWRWLQGLSKSYSDHESSVLEKK